MNIELIVNLDKYVLGLNIHPQVSKTIEWEGQCPPRIGEQIDLEFGSHSEAFEVTNVIYVIGTLPSKGPEIWIEPLELGPPEQSATELELVVSALSEILSEEGFEKIRFAD